MPSIEAALRQRTDEVLHYLWDPCGVAGAPGARDEYRSYVTRIVALVMEHDDELPIAVHLNEISTKQMGFWSNMRRSRHISRVLLAWKKHLAPSP